MSQKELSNPHLTFWKAIYSALGLWAIFAFMNWLFQVLVMANSYGSDLSIYPPLLTAKVLCMGCGWLLVALWSWWSWKPGRKYGRWHRWLASLSLGVYLSFLVLLGGIILWNAILSPPWSLVVDGIVSTVYITAWVLPALSFRWSRKIAYAQDGLVLKMLSYGPLAALIVASGIMGANYGRYAYRHGEMHTALLIMAFGFSLIAIAIAQHNIKRLWPYRPWKEEE